MTRAVTISLAMVLLPLCHALAQSGVDPQTPSTLTIRKQTNLVLVPVVVTDAHGQPVLDLTKDDFQLLQDKHPQSIALFEKPRLEQGPEASQNLVVIVFDSVNSEFLNQTYARDEAIRFLDHHPGKLPSTAILALTSRGLMLMQDFTQDRTALRKAIASAHGQQSLFGEVMAQNRLDRIDPEHTLENLQMRALLAGQVTNEPGSLQSQNMAAGIVERFHQAQQDQQAALAGFVEHISADLTLRALLTLGESLSGLPGRKSVLWVAQTFPFSSNEISRLPGSRFLEQRRLARAPVSVYRDPLYFRTMEVLTNANAAIYPIDPAGLEVGWGWRLDSFGLQEVASLTGGVAYYNRNDIDRVYGLAMADGASAYLLGYYYDPQVESEGWHPLKVQVTGHGKLRVRSRTGFLSMKHADDVNSATIDIISALMSPFDFTAMAVSVEGITHAEHKTGTAFRVGVPAGALRALEAPTPHFTVRIVMLAVSNDGKQHFMGVKDFEHILAPGEVEKLANSRLMCPAELDMPPGRYMLRVVVRDQVSGKIASATGSVQVAPLGP